VTPGQNAQRLLAQLGIIQHAADEARGAIADMQRGLAGRESSDVVHWVPGLLEALDRIQRECGDAQYSARELRDGLPGQDELQPRLL
jgi:hypothetical protein